MAMIRAKEAYLFDKNKKYIKVPTLDVGCGDGEFSKMVWGKMEAGIDLPGSRIDEAKLRKVYKKVIEFNGVKIPLAKHSYNTAVSNCVLEHVDNLEGLLKDLNRVIKPGGYFLTSVMAKPWEDYLTGSMLFGQVYKNWFRKTQEHHNLLTEREWNEIFKATGWTVMEETGYLPPKAGRWVEAWHYLSIGYLISYKLTGKWTWFNPTCLLPIKYMAELMEENTEPDKSGAIFYILRK